MTLKTVDCLYQLVEPVTHVITYSFLNELIVLIRWTTDHWTSIVTLRAW